MAGMARIEPKEAALKIASFVKIVIAAALLGAAAWYFSPLFFAGKADISVSPVKWQGRVDYRRLDQQLTAMMQRPETAGLAVAVVEDGNIRFVHAYGFADRSTGAKVTTDTLFRWASVSKTVTGILATDLDKAGKLDLDEPVGRWQTSLRLPGGAEQRLTFADLLSQRTGLPKNAYDERLEAGENPADLRGKFADVAPQCPPASCHTYQNIAFDAASEIVREVANRPFANEASERLFRPLGMASARYGMSGLTGAKHWARPHKHDQLRPLKEAYWRVPAAAGVSSNITDFAKWMQAAMGLRPDILPDDVTRRVRQSRVATDRLYSGELAAALTGPGYGLAMRSFTYEGRTYYGHSGAVDGYRATMIFDPEEKLGVVAMWNSNWGIPFRIPFAVFDSYHKNKMRNWLDLSDVPRPETVIPPIGKPLP